MGTKELENMLDLSRRAAHGGVRGISGFAYISIHCVGMLLYDTTAFQSNVTAFNNIDGG